MKLEIFPKRFLDTDLTYDQCVKTLKSQKLEVIVTGGSWIIITYASNWIYRNLLVTDYYYSITIDFQERKNDAKIKKISKNYSTWYEEKMGLKSNEILYPVSNDTSQKESRK